MNSIFERKWDFIVVGAGNAALSAANAACDRGKHVLVLEAAPEGPYSGGNSRFVEVFRVAHNGEYGHGAKYTPEEYYYRILKTNPDADKELVRILVDRSIDMIKWLARHNIKFAKESIIDKQYDPDVARSCFRILGGGTMLLHTLRKELTKGERGNRCRLLYNAEVIDIEIENREFKSVTVNFNGKHVKVYGDNLIIASGSFTANLDKLRQIIGDAVDVIKIRGGRYNKGIPLFVMLEKYDAMGYGDMHKFHAPPADARAPKFNAGIAMRPDVIPYSIIVNKKGLRFHDEAPAYWLTHYNEWGNWIIEQPGHIAFSIFDKKALGVFVPPYLPPVTANTLEDLAAELTKYGLENPKQLIETIRTFNEACPKDKAHLPYDPTELDHISANTDPPKSNYARPINTPPFYAYPLVPGLTFVHYSLKIDKAARVVHKSGNPFVNVYAAGESMFANITPNSYVGAVGITMGTTFGIIAAYEGGWP
jgi:tricarballylate dehydrogenase